MSVGSPTPLSEEEVAAIVVANIPPPPVFGTEYFSKATDQVAFVSTGLAVADTFNVPSVAGGVYRLQCVYKSVSDSTNNDIVIAFFKDGIALDTEPARRESQDNAGVGIGSTDQKNPGAFLVEIPMNANETATFTVQISGGGSGHTVGLVDISWEFWRVT